MSSVLSQATRRDSSPLVSVDADDQVRRSQFRSAVDRLAAKAPHGVIRRCFVVDLAATERQWTETEIELNPGDWVTILALGRTGLSGAADDLTGTRAQLWMRVGFDGTILSGTGNTHSFLAFESGSLYLASSLWDERANRTEGQEASFDAGTGANGHLSIGVLLWNGPTLRGLKQIAALGELAGLISSEIDRIRNVEPPEGWQYDRLLGSSEI